jgi:hypothetical protein
MNKSCSNVANPIQDRMDDQEPKPTHEHFCSTMFLDGDGPNAVVVSSVVRHKSVSEHPRDLESLEAHFGNAYQMLSGI